MKQNNSSSQSNEAQLLELALRLTSYPGEPHTHNPQLLVGRLPDTFPADIPLPDGSRVLGSLLKSAEYVVVVLDTSLPAEEVFLFFNERLLGDGWQTFEQLQGYQQPVLQQRGFAPTPVTGQGTSVIYCKGIGGPTLRVHAAAGSNGLTDVHLEVDGRNDSPCARVSRIRWEQSLRTGGVSDLIPLLEAPRGARQKSRGAGNSSEFAYTSAVLETDADLATLNTHYAMQLEKAGWTRTAEGLNDPLVWQTWRFQDEDQQPWNGQFFILKAQDKARLHYLYIQVDWANASE